MKPKIDRLNVLEWETRAKRKGLKSVMSNRWNLGQCEEATFELKKSIFKFIPTLKDKYVLEVGCGIGRFTNDLSMNAKEVHALDISPSMLRRAKENVNNKVVIFEQTAIHEIDFKKYLDFVFEVTVLQHITDQKLFETSIKKIKSATNDLGYIFLCGEMADVRKQISPNTILRTINEYVELMKPWYLIKSQLHSCVTDLYLMTLWKKSGD